MNLKLLIACILILTPMLILKYVDHDIERLGSNYPFYDLKQKKYIMVDKKPSSWVEIKNVSKLAKWAIVVSEDWAFYEHSGVDYNQLKIVLRESLSSLKLARGASTITQQVVKNVFLNSEKSLWRKVKEFVYASRIEKLKSKNQILETYLNIIELGTELYGVKDASWRYFSKAPSKLTAKEGAFLAMLLPNPVRYAQSFRAQRLTPFAVEVIESILVKLRQAKVYTESDRLLARQEILFINDEPVEAFDPVADGYVQE